MSDIVTRLRKSDVGYLMIKMFMEAADEIERLRNERNAFEAERDELVRISNKLKHERDEARREVCDRAVAEYLPDGTINYDKSGKWRGVASLRGWDFDQETLL